MPNTSDPDPCQQRPVKQEWSLIHSLQQHPLLLVLRPDQNDLDRGILSADLLEQLDFVQSAGLRHLEVAWDSHPGWCNFVENLRSRFDHLVVGAASVISPEAVDCIARLELPYSMSPCLDPALLNRASQQDVLLVPGVFTPSEVMQAIQLGCRLVKLFPAAEVGPSYWRRLQAPLGELPFVIAAGGLVASDIRPWLDAGHGAVALGRRVISERSIDADLLAWLRESTFHS